MTRYPATLSRNWPASKGNGNTKRDRAEMTRLEPATADRERRNVAGQAGILALLRPVLLDRLRSLTRHPVPSPQPWQ